MNEAAAPTIRPATTSDALAIATVHVRSWQSAYRGLLPQSYLDAMDSHQRAPSWEIILDATDWPTRGTLVLVEDDGRDETGRDHVGADSIVGFATVSPSRDEDANPTMVGELQMLYLDPDRWGRGHGSVLLKAVEDQLREAGFTAATAWVLDTNARARQFYETRGWRLDGATTPHDWGSFVVTDVRYRVPLI